MCVCMLVCVCVYDIVHLQPLPINYKQACSHLIIGVNRPDLGGTVLNSAAVSRCPTLLAFNPDFTKLLTV